MVQYTRYGIIHVDSHIYYVNTDSDIWGKTMSNTNNRSAKICIWFGIILASLGFGFQVALGSPFEMIHLLDGMNLLPPIWLFNLLSAAWLFMVGFGAGNVMNFTSSGQNMGKSEIYAYRGGLFFLSCFFLTTIRHFVMFFSGKLFLALLISILCLMCSLICAFLWSNVRPQSSAVIMFAFSIWQFYLFFVNVSVFLHN